jgi:hypothetical protein
LGSSASGSVFVDPTGRRRRLVTVVGVGAALLLVGALALLTAGVLGASPVPLPGLPQGGQGAQEEAVVPAQVVTPAESVASRTAGPARAPAVVPPGPSVTPAPPAPSSSAPEPRTRGNRPSTHPGNGNPRASKSK